MRVAVVFAPTKLEIAGMRARRHVEKVDGRLDVRQERQFVAWFEQVLRHERGRIDLATLVHLAVVVDPVKVQVRLVRGKLRLQLDLDVAAGRHGVLAILRGTTTRASQKPDRNPMERFRRAAAGWGSVGPAQQRGRAEPDQNPMERVQRVVVAGGWGSAAPGRVAWVVYAAPLPCTLFSQNRPPPPPPSGA